jgi:hypothetical protein
MNTTSHFAGVFQRVLDNPTGGVAGMVDELLALCLEHDVQLDWQLERCRIRRRGGEWEELVTVPIDRPFFRAILARIAVLCNERVPNSVSPYGGHGELLAGANPRTAFKVTFTNTPAEQHVTLSAEHALPVGSFHGAEKPAVEELDARK